jgi:carboxymethylenebutenolidase
MDQRIINLYDAYTHGHLNRRDFLDRLAALAGGAAAGGALLSTLRSNYALAEVVPQNDPRIGAETVTIPGVQGLTGYLVRPKDDAGKLPAVLVIPENRGLNPHIKDVTRRIALEGFLALGLDYFSPMGGTPPDEDKAREMFERLQQSDALASARAAVTYLKRHPSGNGRVGAVGFCWGGGLVNNLAVSDPDLDAAVVYYGAQPKAEDVLKIRAPLLLHYAGLDQRTNAGIPAYEAALKQAGKSYELHMYHGVNHAFNNDTGTARYDKAAADLAWSRTIAFLKKHLAQGAR